ncbi:hypothetical protein M8542_02930 [Amycolatopsis sp. OK19-0408]|uniref:RapZ C-terminal domain-containing protein n=1 Tax=Amycolatopsis iheyensis TaxID=2945988 RepID=A0A9X2SHF1_9PSEU|nr:RNase adapter RapZ [Amycolatopsis iheyensis]MCR6481763.1 hypothetical protein [Amycolatopsis iheyensis]
MDLTLFDVRWPGTEPAGEFGLRAVPAEPMVRTQVVIESFGFLHRPARPLVVDTPHLVIDLRELLRDPHVPPALRYGTGRDHAVRVNVLTRPGAIEFVRAQAAAIAALVIVARPDTVKVTVGCSGGRHRSVVVAEALALVLAQRDVAAGVYHRDIRRPVVSRTIGRADEEREVSVPSAGLPKDGNGSDQGLYVGTLVVEASFELPATGGSST